MGMTTIMAMTTTTRTTTPTEPADRPLTAPPSTRYAAHFLPRLA